MSLSGSDPLGDTRQSPGALDRVLPSVPQAWGLIGFYNKSSDPWFPKGIIPEDQRVPYRSDVQTFRDDPGVYFPGHRTALPSECDTVPSGVLPSDSGYESRTKHSIGTASVFGDADRSQETQSLAGYFLDYHPFGVSPKELHRETNMQRDHHWSGSASIQPLDAMKDMSDHRLVCPGCNQQVKNRSELTKHEQRHTKPYTCDVPGCSRKLGFGTTNDLDRHKRSVHPSATTPGVRFRCNVGQCQAKDKLWPRADNFRSHLKRVHQLSYRPDQDLTEFQVLDIQESDLSHGLPEGLAHIGSSDGFLPYNASPSIPATSNGAWMEPKEQNTLDAQLGISGSNPEPRMDYEDEDLTLEPVFDNMDPSDQNPPGDLASVSGEASTRSPSTSDKLQTAPESTPMPDFMDSNLGLKPLASVDESVQDVALSLSGIDPAGSDDPDDASKTNALSIAGIATPPTMEPGDIQSQIDSDDSDDEEPRKDNKSNQEHQDRAYELDLKPPPIHAEETMILDYLEKLPPEIIAKYMNNKTVSAAKRSQPVKGDARDASYLCTECSKRFSRKCELKKHLKRHEKPYGCTFPGCTKKFGSKNDWKRHENSQHFQLEVWKCDEKVGDPHQEPCGKVCHRRETFRTHLQKEHKIEDSTVVERALENCRVDKNCKARFWCGFCSQIIEIKKEGSNAWTERFNHIDDHFSGRNNATKKKIKDWKSNGPLFSDIDASASCGDSAQAESPEGTGNASSPASDTTSTPEDPSNPLIKRRRSQSQDHGPNLKRPRKGS